MEESGDPSVSVLLPARNAESTLESCLRSVARQTWPRWECVIVDDGSTDGTSRVARDFGERDPRFRVVRTGADGLVPALNAGLARCRGRFVARMDADDLMHRLRLEEQVRRFQEDPTLAVLGSHVRAFPRGALGPGYRAYERWLNGIRCPADIRREAYVECPLAHPTLMLRRSAIPHGGYRDRGWPEDYDLLLRLLTSGARVDVLPARRHGWRHGTGRLSLSDPAYSDASFTRCKARFLADSFLAGGPSYILWGHGGTGRALRRELAALGKRPSHIVEVHPGRLGNRIDGAPVIPPSALSGLSREPLIASVAGAGPRDEVRRALATLGFVETRDFVCAA